MRLEPSAVESYLSRHLGQRATLRRLDRIPVGLSRGTWVATLDDRKLVLRADQPGGASACPTPLEVEYELYRRLAETELPVARTLWFEPDESVLGLRLYVREWIDGSADVAGFADPDPRNDPIRIEVSREHARKLAAVHALDWRALGLDELLEAPAGPRDSAHAAVERIQRKIRAITLEPIPVLDLIAKWLREQAPTTSPGVVLCKGSNGAMQEIWRDGTIVGMSDWELASIGDPTSDWARCQGYIVSVEGTWDERRLLDYYASLSGLGISDEAMTFYRHLYRFEMLLVGLHSALPVIDGTLPDARLAFLASETVIGGIASFAQVLGLG
jgi:aminoglycoside phosphotransferase (APT) family kinase protein